MLKVITLGLKGFIDLEDEVPGVYTPGTGQLAFAAEHAAGSFFPETPGFTPFHQQDDFAKAEIGKPGGGAGCSTGTAGDAEIQGRLGSRNLKSNFMAVAVEIDLPVLIHRVPETGG